MPPSGETVRARRQVAQPQSEPSTASFSLADVAKHNTAGDCWLVVRGKVYDVTAWVPSHPGGPLIHVAAGRDVTLLFDAYHPLHVSGMLPKYYVGELVLAPGEAPPVSYEPELGEGQLYNVLKKRVAAYFKETGLDPRTHPAMFLKSAAILLTLLLAWLGAFFLFPASLPASLACAALLGVMKAEVGVSIQHDANHGAYSRSGALGRVMGATLDVAGASSFMWRQQHVVGHHAYTNVEGLDPDIRVGEKDVRRVAPQQPWQPWHAAQHLYLGLLYSLLAVKSIYLDDFAALAAGAIGPVQLAPRSASEVAVFWGGKALYAAYMHVLPLLYSAHSGVRLLALWACADAVTGWMLALMFQVAHVVDEVAYPDKPGPSGRVPRGWAAAQLATTADFSHGSAFWTHVSGGLNYQAVHHLFPGICHCHYPALAPIIMRTAAEFGVPYKVYPSFAAALGGHFRHLRALGWSKQGVPSLATVG